MNKLIGNTIIICCTCLSSLFGQSDDQSTLLNKATTLSLNGRLSDVYKMLDDDQNLTHSEREFKKKFQQRFIDKNDSFEYNTGNEEIIEFVNIFHSYWRSVMMEEVDVEIADSKFMKKMSSFLFINRFNEQGISIEKVQSDIYQYGNDYLKSFGYYSNAFGKTGHLFDLFLWKDNQIKVFNIELIDSSVDVTVHYLDNFISKGWTHYATFGEKYASGWATSQALYCIISAYDLNSEKFEISYLAHEGQHFQDYMNFPKLIQKDLEYRSKLVEITKSDKTTLNIISKFISNSSPEGNNAHAFANYCVIRDLSEELLVDKPEIEIKIFEKINIDLIKNKAEVLFNKHTSQLNLMGSKTTTSLIK